MSEQRDKHGNGGGRRFGGWLAVAIGQAVASETAGYLLELLHWWQ